MKNKVIWTLLCICIVTFGGIPAIGMNLNPDSAFIEELELPTINNVENNTYFLTLGPVTNPISEVEFINGSSETIWDS